MHDYFNMLCNRAAKAECFWFLRCLLYSWSVSLLKCYKATDSLSTGKLISVKSAYGTYSLIDLISVLTSRETKWADLYCYFNSLYSNQRLNHFYFSYCMIQWLGFSSTVVLCMLYSRTQMICTNGLISAYLYHIYIYDNQGRTEWFCVEPIITTTQT